MAKTLKIKRSQLTVVERLIRLRFLVPSGSMSGGLEIIEQSEHSAEHLELVDAEGSTPLGRVTVFSRRVTQVGMGQEEWVVRLQPEDKRAEDTLAALPPGPPDPY